MDNYDIQFQPMTISQILDKTFRIYKSNFITFVAIVAIIEVPISLLQIGGMSLMTPDATAAFAEWEAGQYDPEQSDLIYENGQWALVLAGIVISIMFGLMGTLLTQAAIMKGVSEYYLGNQITTGQAYRAILPKLPTLIGASILVGITVMLGYLVFIVPGIIFWVWFTLTTPAIVAENTGAVNGMARSRALIQGNFGKIFGVLILTSLISWAIHMLLSMGGSLISATVVDSPVLTMTINNIFSTLASIIAAPIIAAALVLAYYDLRIRKEGFDLEMIVEAMELGGSDGMAEI